MRIPLLAASLSAALGLVLTGWALWEPAPSADPLAMGSEASDPDALLATLPSLRLADPVGDATDTGAGDAATLAGCAVGGALGGDCLQPPAKPPRAGTAGPHFDITSLVLAGETARDLVVELQVAKLSPGFVELANPDGFVRMNYYTLCWAASADAGCDRSVRLDVMRHGESVHSSAKFEIRNGRCNEWSWCSWGVPVDFSFGEPASMTFRVPKAYMEEDGGPLSVHHLEAQTGWVSEPEVLPAWHPGVTAHVPAYHFHTHGGAISGLNIADVSERLPVGRDLTPVPTEEVAAGHEPLLLGEMGANHGASSPYNYDEMDLLWFDLHEEAGDLVARFAVKELHDLPSYDFDYSVGVGIGRQVWEIGYRHEGSARGDDSYYGYAGRCIMEMCQDGQVMTPAVETTFGEPGIISVRTPLSFIGNPEPGTATNLFWAMTMYSDYNLYWGGHEDDAYGDVHSVFEIDSLRGGGTPYVFGSGHKADASQATGHGH